MFTSASDGSRAVKRYYRLPCSNRQLHVNKRSARAHKEAREARWEGAVFYT